MQYRKRRDAVEKEKKEGKNNFRAWTTLDGGMWEMKDGQGNKRHE